MANTFTDDVIMAALQYVIPGAPYNTRLAQLGGPVVIQDEYALSNGRFPAVHVEVDKQKHTTRGNAIYDAEIVFLISYYDRWDQNTTRIDVIRSQINADLQTIMNNIQRNSSLTVGSQDHVLNVHQYELSPYKGELDDKTIPGLTLVKRFLRITVSVLPYDA